MTRCNIGCRCIRYDLMRSALKFALADPIRLSRQLQSTIEKGREGRVHSSDDNNEINNAR